ncbi:MauE/DoxX family redox-associated membrane protein [Agreia sp. PsM10]|uniref:MauE/DoxX family redox-associated membrane protein n=1 Tax=Agreia sp. PsM10 TaxID=3030533 RepID=UPI00263A4379|nr:MauE/DoxX family redox-associated membrane protein [Agreia sp. PsM10]MDN4641611.1 MauE/DoxX family redox-associated membrane protein [Agreia sp. PsM10]
MTMVIVFPIFTTVILLLGGLTKIGNVQATLTSFEHFRLPAFLMRAPLAAAFPAFELLLAFGLLFAEGPAYLAASAAAELLMAAYVLLVLRAVNRGDEFDCGCFGAAINSPIGWTLVWRNLFFFVIASVSFMGACFGIDSVRSVLMKFSPSDRGWAIVLVLATTLYVGRLYSRTIAGVGRMSATAGVPASSPADGRIPPAEVVTSTGAVFRLEDLSALRPQLVVFVRSGCSSCDEVIRKLTPFALSMDARIGVIFAVVGTAHSVFEVDHPGLQSVSVFAVIAAQEKLGIVGTPSAVVLGLNGRLETGPVLGPPAILALLPPDI